MRPVWTGAIGFGLVNIPVKMYSATQESNLDLDMLDKKDLSNIHFQRINAKTGKEVTWENIVKGYKLKDKYIVLTDKDFEAASAKNQRLLRYRISWMKQKLIRFIMTGLITSNRRRMAHARMHCCATLWKNQAKWGSARMS
jgi:Ku protein